MRSHRESRSRPPERGAALTEFALLLPLLMMLVLGLVSVGIAYNHQLAITHAAREASRFAATLPVTNFNTEPVPMEAWLDAIAVRTEQNATGSLDPSTPGRVVCVAYVHPNGTLATDSTTRRLDDTGTVTYSNADCFSDGRPATERRVQVQVSIETDFDVLLFSRTLTLDSEATSRFEAALGS